MEDFQSKDTNRVAYKGESGKRHDDGRSPKQPTPIGFQKGGSENIIPFKQQKQEKT
jgi:hypothetical protein